jgi:hypothetical protein
MGTRGLVYVVRAQRTDDAWITFRTCDRVEADRMAGRLGVLVTIE